MKISNDMAHVKKLIVKYHDKVVGTLALMKDKRVAFSYDSEWIINGFSISPFELPLKESVAIGSKAYFNYLPGVFYDSLPDSWGELLFET